jgi:hypothetical protein
MPTQEIISNAKTSTIFTFDAPFKKTLFRPVGPLVTAPRFWWLPFIVFFGVVTLARFDNVLTPGQKIRFNAQQSVSD